MPETYELSRMLEDILEDEKVSSSKSKKVSQDEIRKLLQEKRRLVTEETGKCTMRMGETLVKAGIITLEQLQTALKRQSQAGGRIGSILIELGYITDEVLIEQLKRQKGYKGISLVDIDLSESLLSLLPSTVIIQQRVLPLKVEGRTLTLGMDDPNNAAAIHEVEFITGKRVNPIVIPSYQMDVAMMYIEEKGARFFSGSEIKNLFKGPGTIQTLLQYLMDSGASDLLVTEGVPPTIKLHGSLKRSGLPTLTSDQCVAYAKSLMTEIQWEDFLKHKELDFAVQYDGIGRFRVNTYRQRNTVSISVRSIADNICSFEKLGLPAWMEEQILKPQGLILITAPTGHGKTTTISALIDAINRKRACNIITLEDPVEYIHKPIKSNINQREVGRDTDSFLEGMRRVFRQAPDVIFIGELRDEETFETALRAASTGHLVMSTMHAGNATATIDGVIKRFPQHAQGQVRSQLADALLFIFSQRLIPALGGKGRVLAHEKLINSYRIRNFIREGKVHQIRTQMPVDSEDFTSIDVCLLKLVREGKINAENALLYADNPDFLGKTPKSGAGGAGTALG